MHWGIYPTDRVLSLHRYPAQLEFGPCPEGRKSILGGGAPHVKTRIQRISRCDITRTPAPSGWLRDELAGLFTFDPRGPRVSLRRAVVLRASSERAHKTCNENLLRGCSDGSLGCTQARPGLAHEGLTRGGS